MSLTSNEAEPVGIIIIYDGDCPFCTQYVRMLRLRHSVGPVELLNARGGGDYVEEAKQAGLDLNQGMAVWYGGNWYHGAECMHLLASLTSRSGLLNSLVAKVFRSRARSRFAYPLLRAGRNVVLRMLGRSQIE